jgi:aldehyde dehydrogenase (NAD+)
MTFRSHGEAIKLANNTRYGLAASIWTENINLALDVAPKVKAGSVWINCTNQFDAASGFGGYRESGFGREGGKEGLYEYLKPKSEALLSSIAPKATKVLKKSGSILPVIDRTAKLFIGGKQARPDSGYSLKVINRAGQTIAEVGAGNRKDVRNAVEAAQAAENWTAMTGHARAQVLFYLAENLSARASEFAARIILQTGVTPAAARQEVDLSIERIYYYAAQADKYDGAVHHTITRNVTLAMPEALGVMGIICPDVFPLLGLLSNILPPLSMGNRVIVIPSSTAPLSATDLYQVLETSDVPAGVVNIITGNKEELAAVLANHDDVDGVWYTGSQAGCKAIEHAAAENMKRTWVNYGKFRDWTDPQQGQGEVFLRHATQIKNIWIPYGE